MEPLKPIEFPNRKEVDINLAYNFANDSRNIRIQRLKIKEL